MSAIDRIGGIGDNGCTCAIEIGGCPIHECRECKQSINEGDKTATGPFGRMHARCAKRGKAQGRVVTEQELPPHLRRSAIDREQVIKTLEMLKRIWRAGDALEAIEEGIDLVRALPAVDGAGGPKLIGTIDARCHCAECKAKTENIYRMVGKCSNCGSEPWLVIFRAGDPARAVDCPRCGVREKVYSSRLATDHEIPAPETGDEQA